LFRQNPVQGLFQIAKDANPAFSRAFAENFKHTRKAECQVIGDEKGAPRLRRKNIAQSQLLNIGRGEVDLRNMREIHELRITGVEFRISEQALLMGLRRFFVKDSSSRAEDKPSFLVDFIEGWHGFRVPRPSPIQS
jgi:hypothetical protein